MMVRPKFEPVINLGHILTAVTMAGALIGILLKMSAWQSSTDSALAATQERASKYIPLIESGMKANDIQDERIANIVDALKENRKANIEILQSLNEIKLDVAVLKTQGANRK
jgi:hypothetical protein